MFVIALFVQYLGPSTRFPFNFTVMKVKEYNAIRKSNFIIQEKIKSLFSLHEVIIQKNLNGFSPIKAFFWVHVRRLNVVINDKLPQLNNVKQYL